MNRNCTLLPILVIFAFTSEAQVNAYARVTSISSTVLNVSSANETYSVFSSGTQVIIMQMQDDVIGTTANNTNFGNLSSISSAGDYEIANIASVERSGGILTKININSPLAKTFITGSNSSVQVISFPVLGSSGFTTNANISAVVWDGSVGGVVAFRVNGTLTLMHNITADNAGFRGGAINGGNAGSCDVSVYRISSDELYANKGEGIYRATNNAYAAGRGKILNGGGGGSSHNAGGGGGSNITAGGEGGKGYNCSSAAGGLGGITLSTFVSSNRIFMGGGGGAGEANNGYNTAGGNGGGIVIIKATQIVTSGSGSTLRISANGQTAADVGNDGAGGGGGGGSILLDVQSWNIAASKTLNIWANGGSGGNVSDAAAHGGGAGGGQGAVIFSTSVPSINISTATNNGNGGRNYTGGTFAANGAGSNNQGIYNHSFALLPVKLLSFRANENYDNILFEWEVINEYNLNRYEVQRSEDGNDFETIGTLKVRSTNLAAQKYQFTDYFLPVNTTYYRLMMIDNDHQYLISNTLSIRDRKSPGLVMSLLPNPVSDRASLNVIASQTATAYIRIYNAYGIVLHKFTFQLNAGENIIPINISGLSAGTYQVQLTSVDVRSSARMMVIK